MKRYILLMLKYLEKWDIWSNYVVLGCDSSISVGSNIWPVGQMWPMELLCLVSQATSGPWKVGGLARGGVGVGPATESGAWVLLWTWRLVSGRQVRETAPVMLQPLCPSPAKWPHLLIQQFHCHCVLHAPCQSCHYHVLSCHNARTPQHERCTVCPEQRFGTWWE